MGLASRESASNACLRALRESILAGEYAPGTRLPPERQLAADFGVNRVTVRSALAQLEAARLVSVRQGSGYVVRDFRREAGPDLIRDLIALARSKTAVASIVADLLAVRRSVAQLVLERLGATSVRQPALRAIARAVDALEQAAKGDAPAEKIARADLEVARALVAATGSAVLQLFLNPVAAVLTELPALQRAMYRRPEEIVASYRMLVAWLETGGGDMGPMLAELERHDARTLAALAPATSKRSRTR